MGSSWPHEGMKGQTAGAESNVARVVGAATVFIKQCSRVGGGS